MLVPVYKQLGCNVILINTHSAYFDLSPLNVFPATDNKICLFLPGYYLCICVCNNFI